MSKSKRREYKDRKITDQTDSNDILSCSLPRKLNENITTLVEQNKTQKIAGQPTNRSQFAKVTMAKFIKVMERLMKIYPALFVNDNNDPNFAEALTLNYGAEKINELSELVNKCTALYNRSEVVRMSIIVYYILEMIGKDLTVEKEVPVDTKTIQHIMIDGKLRPILKLEYQSPAEIIDG